MGESVATGLQQKGWILSSLWSKPAFNVTLLNTPLPTTASLPLNAIDKVKRYLLAK